MIRLDNGPELVSHALRDYYANKIGLRYIPPGQPWRNGYAESFNNRCRDGCLNLHEFDDLIEAQIALSDWKTSSATTILTDTHDLATSPPTSTLLNASVSTNSQTEWITSKGPSRRSSTITRLTHFHWAKVYGRSSRENMKHTTKLIDGYRKYFLPKQLEPSIGVFFEEQPTQRFVSTSSEVVVAVSPIDADPITPSTFQYSFSNWDIGKKRRDAAWRGDWKVSLYLPRTEVPAKARTFPVAYAWDTYLTENYPTKGQADARALQLATWWCDKDNVPFNPALAPYPIEARLNVTGILTGWIVCMFSFMALFQILGVGLSTIPTWGNTIFMMASLIVGGTIAELTRRIIQMRKLKRIRTICIERYNQVNPTN